MWGSIDLRLAGLLAVLGALALVYLARRSVRRKEGPVQDPEQQAQRGGGGPTKPVVPK